MDELSIVLSDIEYTNNLIGNRIGDFFDDIFKRIGKLQEWVKDQLGKFTDKITNEVEKALTKFRNYLIEKLLAFSDWLKEMKYKFRQLMADIMGDVWGFWAVIFGVAVLCYYFPQIVAFIKNTKIYIYLAKVWEVLKSYIGTFLQKIGYIQALQVHRVMLILNPKYQEWWNKLDVAFSAMAEEVELGVGVLSLLTYNIKALYFSVYTLFGVDADTIEMKAYDDITRFWADKHKKWVDYVTNPQQIFLDAMRELVYPLLAEQAEYGSERAQEELRQAKRIDQALIDANDVRIKLNTLIDGLPDEIANAVKRHAQPFLDYVNDQFTRVVEPWIKKIQDSVNILEETNNEIRAAVALNSLRRRTVGDFFFTVMLDGSVNDASRYTMLRESLGYIYGNGIDEVNSILLKCQMEDVATDNNTPTEAGGGPIYPEPESIDLDFPNKPISVKPWFVGEY